MIESNNTITPAWKKEPVFETFELLGRALDGYWNADCRIEVTVTRPNGHVERWRQIPPPRTTTVTLELTDGEIAAARKLGSYSSLHRKIRDAVSNTGVQAEPSKVPDWYMPSWSFDNVGQNVGRNFFVYER